MTTLSLTKEATRLDDAVSCLREYRGRLRLDHRMRSLYHNYDPHSIAFADLQGERPSIAQGREDEQELQKAANALETALVAVLPVDDPNLTETIELVRVDCRTHGIGAEMVWREDIFDLLDKVEEGLVALRKVVGKTRRDLPDPIPNVELATIIGRGPDYVSTELRAAVDPKKAKPRSRDRGQKGLTWSHADLDRKVQYLRDGRIKTVLQDLGFGNPNRSS